LKSLAQRARYRRQWLVCGLHTRPSQRRPATPRQGPYSQRRSICKEYAFQQNHAAAPQVARTCASDGGSRSAFASTAACRRSSSSARASAALDPSRRPGGAPARWCGGTTRCRRSTSGEACAP
jgi:hypothetical protein